MPSQKHSGLHGVPWHRCDRCGFDYQVDKLVRQRGLIVCVEKCLDKTDIWSRDAIISQVLQSSEEEPATASILKNDRSDDEETSGFYF